MKINVKYGKQRFTVNIRSTDTIYKVKQKIRKRVDVEQPVTNVISRSTLFFAGTSLCDDMIVNDIGIVSGSTLLHKCMITEQCRLKIYVNFLKKTIELGKEFDISTMTIGDVSVFLQNQIGIPVSMFYIIQPVNAKRELFDIHGLTYYGIHEGDTLVLHLWKVTRRVVMNAMNCDISGTMSNLPKSYEHPTLNRYLLRVVLFIAAHFDHMKLAAQVLLRGIRCEEPVGEHSSRQWCCTKSHPEVFKTPIHQAAQQGSFQCLKMFIRHSPSSLICRDGNCLTPGNYAAMNKNIDCWKLIVASQFMHTRICGFSLQSHLRIMKWCTAAKERVNYFKGDAKKSILLHSTLGTYNNTYLGNSLHIDGFNNKTFYEKYGRTCASPQFNTITSTRRFSSVKPLDSELNNISLPETQELENANQKTTEQSTSKLLKRDLKKKLTVNVKKESKKDDFFTTKLLATTSAKPRKKKKSKKGMANAKKMSPNQGAGMKKMNEITRTIRLDAEIVLGNDPHRNPWRPKSTSLLFGSEAISVIGPERTGFTPLFRRFQKDMPNQTNSLILSATGMNPHDLACTCLQLGERFCRKSWMRQFTIAVNSSKNRIARGRPRSPDAQII